MPREYPRVKPGEPITARFLNLQSRGNERNQLVVGPQSGLNATTGRLGTVIRSILHTVCRIAYTDGAGLTARSGTTPGSGTAALVDFDPRGPTLITGATNVKVFNLAHLSVAATTYIIVLWIGAWWCVWEECP